MSNGIMTTKTVLSRA